MAFAEKPKALVLVCIVTAGDIVLAKPVEPKEPAVKDVKTVLIKALANTLPVLLKGLSENDVKPNTNYSPDFYGPVVPTLVAKLPSSLAHLYLQVVSFIKGKVKSTKLKK